MRISVVIPTYNREKYICECVKSAIQQTYNGDYDVIVVDDGSIDTTPKILSPFKGKIIYKKINNSGRPAVPRNVGVNIAKGEYVAFLDSDDIWMPNKLEAQVRDIQESKSILSYSNAEIIDSSGNSTGGLVLGKNQGRRGAIFQYLLKDNIVSTLTVLASKKHILDAGGFDEAPVNKVWEDYDLWLRMSLMGNFSYISKPLAKYRRHDSNISQETRINDLQKKVYSMNKLKSVVNNHKHAELIKIRLVDLYCELASLHDGSRKYYWKMKARLV